jgi:lipopolysaccharide export system protein LptA
MSRSIRILIIGFLLAAPLVVPGSQSAVRAAGPGPEAPSGPIDITANEQEFSGNQVIARGNVHVKYKDSVVVAPMAALIRDAGGSPQSAIFTGHPHLTQGQNKIDAETLVFEMANSKIVAQGRAHSEVISSGGEDQKGGTSVADSAKSTLGTAPDEPNAGLAEVADQTPDSRSAPKMPANAAKAPVEKIITDSDRQEYDQSSGKFDALGHVRVVHGNILVKADKLTLVYGLDKKPETALFTGNVTATQDRNNTIADQMAYNLSTKRLQATGHVKSTVIQEHKDEKDGKKKPALGFDPAGMQSAVATEIEQPKDDIVIITSETQDFSKQTGRMSATGNVRVLYQDTTGSGPQAVLLRNPQGKCDRVIFSGRSQISQPGRRWIADRIEMTINDKKVLASGNTKALILQTPGGNKKNAPQMQLAGRPTSISASPKGERPQ